MLVSPSLASLPSLDEVWVRMKDRESEGERRSSGALGWACVGRADTAFILEVTKSELQLVQAPDCPCPSLYPLGVRGSMVGRGWQGRERSCPQRGG